MLKKRGYTLIEVLVAMMLLALVLTVLMSTFSSSLRNVDTAQTYSRAILLAESRLAAQGVTEPLRTGESVGEEGGLAWQVRVEEFPVDGIFPDDDLLPDAYVVEVSVTWNATGRDRHVTLASMKLDQRAGQ